VKMVKKAEVSSQMTKEDSEPKTNTQSRSFETSAKALRRKKNRASKQAAKREKLESELAQFKAENEPSSAKPDDALAKEPVQKEEETKIEFEYTNANEMEELGASKAYAEFMQVF